MLQREKDDARDDEIEIGRPERSGKARLRLRVCRDVANTDEVDVGAPVDLPSGQEEGIDRPWPAQSNSSVEPLTKGLCLRLPRIEMRS